MRQAAEKGLYSAGLRLVEHITTEIIPQTNPEPVDRGMYRAGWRATRLPGEGCLVSNTLPYAPIIEYGARGANIKIGRKMIDALAKWVMRKGLTGNTKGKARADEARQIAWAIAMSMKRTGIFNGGKGLRVLERASKRIPAFMKEEIARELKKL